MHFSISYPSGTTTALEYDGGASPTAATKGELTKMTNEFGVVSFGYDPWAWQNSSTQVYGRLLSPDAVTDRAGPCGEFRAPAWRVRIAR